MIKLSYKVPYGKTKDRTTEINSLIDFISKVTKDKDSPEEIQIEITGKDQYWYSVFHRLKREVKGRSKYLWHTVYPYTHKSIVINLVRKSKANKFKRAAKLGRCDFRYPARAKSVTAYVCSDGELSSPKSKVKIMGILNTDDQHYPKVEFFVDKKKIVNLTEGKKETVIVCNTDDLFGWIKSQLKGVKGV